MQRLFAAFPDAWPGAGLLLLRMAASVTAVMNSIPALLSEHSSPALWTLLDGAGGSLLLVGLWTPLGGALLVLAQLWTLVQDGHIDVSRALVTIIAASLIMLGPGAWSVDARLYGRKRIEVRGR